MQNLGLIWVLSELSFLFSSFFMNLLAFFGVANLLFVILVLVLTLYFWASFLGTKDLISVIKQNFILQTIILLILVAIITFIFSLGEIDGPGGMFLFIFFVGPVLGYFVNLIVFNFLYLILNRSQKNLFYYFRLLFLLFFTSLIFSYYFRNSVFYYFLAAFQILFNPISYLILNFWEIKKLKNEEKIQAMPKKV